MTLTREEVEQLADPELEQLLVIVQAAWSARIEAALSEERINDAVAAVHANESPGDEWVAPVSRAKGYPKGAVRTWGGTKYISTSYANVSEPGTPGAEWSVVTGEHPEWQSGMQYDRGAMVIRHAVVYVSARSRNATEPGTRAGRLHWSVAEEQPAPTTTTTTTWITPTTTTVVAP